MKNFNVTHKEIIKYWSGKYITRHGEILDVPNDVYDDVLVAFDPYEPSCWACDKPVKKMGDLERAHIKPRALSKDDSPSNLFLLCKDCHFESPDYMDSKYFFVYIYKKSKRSAMGFDMGIITNALADIESLTGENVDYSIFDNFNPDLTKMNTHGSKLVNSTIQSVITDWYMTQCNNKRN